MEAYVDTLCVLAQPELTENQMARKSDTKEIKKETFIQTSRRGGDGQPAERTCSKVAAGGPSKVADCGTGQARLQLADPAAPHSCIDKLG